MNIRGITFFIILILISGFADNVRAQSFDYASYPPLDFSINHLDLDLVLNPDESSIQGAANFEMRAKIDGVDTLIIHASRMQINTVSVNNGSADYHLRNDSLFIGMGEETVAGRRYTVSITYETMPRFGLLKNNEGTVWTSLLPRSTRHWLPIVDHPRIFFSCNFSLTVPSGFEVAATGMQMDRKAMDVDNIVFTFRTERSVPASALAFAVGKFEKEQTSFGLKRISLLSERNVLTAEEQRQLLGTATDVLRDIQNNTDHEYPFEGLNIVVLRDHYWETKSWGASVIYLYENRGDLEAQLRRGIYGQWFGIYQREERWKEAEAMSLYQTTLHYRLNNQPALLKSNDEPAEDLNTVYSAFEVSVWNRWQEGFSAWADSNWKEIVSRTMDDVLKEGEGVYTWNDYARFWYEQSGQPFFDASAIRFPSAQDTVAQSDSVSYRVDYVHNESENTVTLYFTAQQGVYDELITLPMIQTASGDTDTSEITFTGAKDSVIVSVSPMVQNVHIDASPRPELSLDQYKPASFLVYALRNGPTIEERKEAAEKLGAHTDNPDLQLAIRDFLKREELDPEVRAALLGSLANITKGANGTEQIFMDALGSDQFAVQQTGLMALQHYPENETVRQTVRTYALESDSLPVFKNGVRIFSDIADSTSFDEFVRQVVRTDTAGYRAIFAIQEWVNSGQAERGVRQTEFYTSDTYDYPVREMALQVLIQHDHTPEDWRARAGELLDDVDPRVRLLVVRGLSNVNGLDPAEVIIPRIKDEYDARVYQEMQEVVK